MYAKAARNKAPGVEHGPTFTVFVSLLESLLEQDIGQANKKKVNDIKEELDREGPSSSPVRVCRWARCFKDTHSKLHLCIDNPDWRVVILASLIQVEGQVKSGQVPAGHLEDELVQWLEIVEASQ